VNTVLARGSLLGRPTEAIVPRSNVNILETELGQIGNDLCLRQSAGDSTGPKIDTAAGVFWQFKIEGDVGQMKPAAGPEHSEDLGKGASFLRH
jgi:hypothetical protein